VARYGNWEHGLRPFVTASLTNYCNLGCGYCVANSFDWVVTKDSKPRMIDFLHPVALSKWVNKHWPEGTVIDITGGEPSVHPYFEDALRYLAANHKVVVFSNGMSIPQGLSNIDVFWNLTYHADTCGHSFEEWLFRNKEILREKHRICHLSKTPISFEVHDRVVDFRVVGKSDELNREEYEYSNKPTAHRFALVTPDGLAYLCNHCGPMYEAARQPNSATRDCVAYYKKPRKKNHIGDVYAGEYSADRARKGDKHVRDCLRHKKCWAYITQARIEYCAKEQGFL